MNAVTPDDRRWLAAAAAVGSRMRALSTPNPNVGCVLVREGRVIGRGWTQAGGRPHAEAMALTAAGAAARGATAYVTLEACAHASERGGSCSSALIAAGVARVVASCTDPDPRTAGQGFAALSAAGIIVAISNGTANHEAMPWFIRQQRGRPFVTLKLATSLDGQIALADGQSRWITGDRARAHTHLERARHEAILVGGGTLRTDNPRLDVRLPGLEDRSPQRFVLTRGNAPDGWTALNTPDGIGALLGINSLFVEGGAETAAAFLRADLVDRLLLYRAPLLIGAGRSALADIGLSQLSDAHGQWRLTDTRMLGSDRMDDYCRVRED